MLEPLNASSADFYLAFEKAYLRSRVNCAQRGDVLTANAAVFAARQTDYNLLKAELEFARGRLEEAKGGI